MCFARILDAQAFSILAILVRVLQACFVADAVDSFAKIFRRIGFVRFVAKEASGAIGVCSTRDGNASVILAGILCKALIVLVAIHSVAGVHFGWRFSGIFVVAFPCASFAPGAVQICTTFYSHASFFLTLCFRPALRVISAQSCKFVELNELS